MNSKYILILFFFMLFFVLLDVFIINEEDNMNERRNETMNKTHIGDAIESYFCRDIDCEKLYLELFDKVEKSVYCAFFDFDLIKMMKKFDDLYINGKKVLVLVDGDNKIFNKSDYEFLFFDKRSAFMHNKFCLLDNKILVTGSFNPTINGRDKNDNNIIVVKNKEIVEIYENYFKNLILESTNINYTHSRRSRNFRINDMEICFSRGGNCLDILKRYLLKANESIKFMTFSFTDDDIESLLLYKYYLDNVHVEGIFERSSISKYSAYKRLSFQLRNDSKGDSRNHSILKDCSKGKMHHKVFVIDKKIVVTGSFNPSSNADKNNDENMIIINDAKVAENYIKEYERLRLLCMI